MLTFLYHIISFFTSLLFTIGHYFQAFLAIEEKGIPYRQHIITIHGGENLEPWYMRIQPNGTVPTLTNGQIVKDDSRDIILYLDELTPDGKIVLKQSNRVII